MTAAVLDSSAYRLGAITAEQTQRITAPSAMAVLLLPALCALFLSKFAIPPYGAQGIGITVFVILLVVGAGFCLQCMRVDPVRAALFLVLTGALGIVPLLLGESFSLNSVFLFTAVHVPLIFSVAAGRDAALKAAKIFLQLCFALAWLGIAQFFAQFVVDASYVFPIENFVPPVFVVEFFNQQGPFGYGLDVFRSNGVFLLEPSYFAQLMAIAVVAELCIMDRVRRLPVYGLALLLAHSGTGIMILAVCLPLFVISRKRWDLLLIGALALIPLIVLREYLFLDRLMARAGEFGSIESSGFARFVGGFYFFEEFLWNDPLRTLFGAGAGSFQVYAPRSAYTAAEMPLFKALFEFGLLGTIAVFGFLAYCLFSRTISPLTSLAIAICFLLNGLYVPFAHAIALSLVVWPQESGDSP